MNILSYVRRGRDIVVTTDFALMPVFVYPGDRFNNKRALRREINKKIREVTRRRDRRRERRDALENDLDA